LTLDIIKLGLIEYNKAYKIQEKIRKEVIDGSRNDTLLLLEHTPVITLGTRGKNENLLVNSDTLQRVGIEVVRTDRGGDITYHGPGQIVGYPILNLNNHGKDIKAYVQNIESVFIRLLMELFNIKAHMEEGKYAGVWVGTEKITAVGISVRKWVTMHGFAFNIKTNLKHFEYIMPCGLFGRSVTSLEKLLNREVSINGMISMVIRYFTEIFKYEDIKEISYE